MEATVTAIDDLWWTATKFSDVLKWTARVCQQALETAPYKMIGKRQVWHVREGCGGDLPPQYGAWTAAPIPSIPPSCRPKTGWTISAPSGSGSSWRKEVRVLLPANEVETTWGDACKTIAQHLDTLADHLGRDAALPPDAVMLVQRAVDVMRERMYESVVALTETDLMKKPQLQQIPTRRPVALCAQRQIASA